MKHKHEALSKFIEWKKLVETETGKKIKTLRTENGLEYCNKEFDDLCVSNGITRHKTYTYTPQQNGIAERMNKTILNKVRCMLVDSGLPKKFWAEAANTACYLINRSLSSAIGFTTLKGKWSNKSPSYQHLKIFGCIAFVHSKQGKLDPRAKRCVFLGYPQGFKWNKLWIIFENKTIIRRDVIFNELVSYKTNMQEPKENTAASTQIEVELSEFEPY